MSCVWNGNCLPFVCCHHHRIHFDYVPTARPPLDHRSLFVSVCLQQIHDSSLGSSDDDDILGVLRGPSSFANAFLYVGLGTVALGLVIAFVGTGEKGFKTLELRWIGPSLIGIRICADSNEASQASAARVEWPRRFHAICSDVFTQASVLCAVCCGYSSACVRRPAYHRAEGK